jgi:hypothetical protein
MTSWHEIVLSGKGWGNFLAGLPGSSFTALRNPTGMRGMSLELLRLQSLAHASGFQMLCNRGFETASNHNIS